MEKIKVEGLEFTVITHSDLSDFQKLDFLLAVYGSDFQDLLLGKSYPKSNTYSRCVLKEFQQQLPKEKQQLIDILRT